MNIILLLLLLLLLPIPLSARNITALPNGVLAYKTARAWILNHEWTVIITIQPPDETPLRDWIARSLATFDQLVAAKRIPFDHIPTLRNRLLLLNSEYNTTSVKSIRNRRAPFNFIGSVARSLFGSATEDQVRDLEEIVKQAAVRQDILFHNQEKLASVLNKTKQEAQINQQNIQKIYKDVSALNQALGESIQNAERISAYLGMMDSVSQLEMIHQLTTQRHRIYVATLEAIRNGHLTEDVLSHAQLGEVMRMMTQIGWMLPVPWIRTFSPVQAVSENNVELTAMCTLWAATHEEYARWHIQSMWIPTRDRTALAKLDVRDALVDKTFTQQFDPAECRGKHQQICKVTSTTGRRCEISILGGTELRCKYAISNKGDAFSVTRVIDGSWLIDTANCTKLTIQCPNKPFEHHQICAPSVINTADDCALVWPTGRTYPVHTHLLRVRTPVHVPIRWVPFTLPDKYDNYTLQLHAIHERPVVNSGEDISLKPLPPLKTIPHHRYYTAPIVIIVGVVIALSAMMFCIKQRKFCFNESALDQAMRFIMTAPKGKQEEKLNETVRDKVREDPVPTQSKTLLNKEALSWPKPTE